MAGTPENLKIFNCAFNDLVGIFLNTLWYGDFLLKCISLTGAGMYGIMIMAFFYYPEIEYLDLNIYVNFQYLDGRSNIHYLNLLNTACGNVDFDCLSNVMFWLFFSFVTILTIMVLVKDLDNYIKDEKSKNSYWNPTFGVIETKNDDQNVYLFHSIANNVNSGYQTLKYPTSESDGKYRERNGITPMTTRLGCVFVVLSGMSLFVLAHIETIQLPLSPTYNITCI